MMIIYMKLLMNWILKQTLSLLSYVEEIWVDL